MNFWCGNTAIGLFCPVAVLLLKQQYQKNRILYWGTIKKEKINEIHNVGKQCILKQFQISMTVTICGSALMIISILKILHML